MPLQTSSKISSKNDIDNQYALFCRCRTALNGCNVWEAQINFFFELYIYTECSTVFCHKRTKYISFSRITYMCYEIMPLLIFSQLRGDLRMKLNYCIRFLPTRDETRSNIFSTKKSKACNGQWAPSQGNFWVPITMYDRIRLVHR